jgi:hypothetical protein
METLRRDGRINDLSSLASLEEYHRVLGFNRYIQLEAQFSQPAAAH